jgi:stearoyl-CoA desaturase (Delta-9 desaturase)
MTSVTKATDPRAVKWPGTSAGPGAAVNGRAALHRRAARWKLGGPFLVLHLAVIGVLFVGHSQVALLVALISYLTRAFGITAFYHRCFAHRAFKVPRPVQLAGAVLGAAAAQRGPLWWVAHHRRHHLYTDRPGDPHSPVVDSFWYSHVLWIFDPDNAPTEVQRAQDLAALPEMRFLDRYEYIVPAALGVGTFSLGVVLAWLTPGLGTSGWQMLIWGFVVPTIALYHSTFAVNSLAHRFGRRRFETPDESRNNWFIAALVLGEGWHNNHHRFPNSARQGLGRFELDLTWWGIKVLSAVGLAYNVRQPPSWATRRPSKGVAMGPGPTDMRAGSAHVTGQVIDGGHQNGPPPAGEKVSSQPASVVGGHRGPTA